MTKEVFARGIQFINSFLPEDSSIKKEQLSTYYLILKDSFLVEHFYLQTISILCKEFKFEYGRAPSPSTILEYYNKYIEQSQPTSYKIFEQILLEITMYKQTPKYNQRVKNALEYIGGIEKIRVANDIELKDLRIKFIYAYENNKIPEKYIEKSKQNYLS